MLELAGLDKRFGEKVVLRDLSLTVPPGQMFGFVGTNGAGKTTTMRIALGVLATDAGEEASALLPDGEYYTRPVAPGDAATLVWSANDAHPLAEA